ncbi:hypothetical protein KFE98_17325 [bacterium SCSIO 12741]|nr:hypothetical protein KFE98_17325 [bacterium SCSIO 12741]
MYSVFTQILILSSVLLLNLCSPSHAHAGTPETSTGTFILKGVLFENSKHLRNTEVDILENGRLIETIALNGSHLTLKLDLNKVYKVRFRKQGHLSKTIEVNTHVDSDANPGDAKFKYNFEMDLPTMNHPVMNSFQAEYLKPYVTITYNQKRKVFDFEIDRELAKWFRSVRQAKS